MAYNREDFLRAVSDVMQKTQHSAAQLAVRMQLRGCDISESNVSNYFQRSDRQPSIPADVMKTFLIVVCEEPIEDLRCSVEEAVTILALSPLTISEISEVIGTLRDYFSEQRLLKAFINCLPVFDRLFEFTNSTVRRDFVDTVAGNLMTGSGTLSSKIRNFASYIAEKTFGFTGRNWIFEEIAAFIEDNPRGYYFVLGDPGIGKSALAARFVEITNCFHHFNIQAEGISRTSHFLTNICAQLIDYYQLPYQQLPPDIDKDGIFFGNLLETVSNHLMADEPCIIMIDALDEVERPARMRDGNPLFLPEYLPPNVYIIITVRDDEANFLPTTTCEHDSLTIEATSQQNEQDVKDFLKAQLQAQSGLQAYVAARDYTGTDFVDTLLERSEGNFMYLHYILPLLATDVQWSLSDLPKGLKNYYEVHWRNMRGQDQAVWVKYKLPVLQALAVSYSPISANLIAEYARLEDKMWVYEVLREWKQFLYQSIRQYETHSIKQYRLYHATFLEFIQSKDGIVEEGVNLKAAHRKTASAMLKKLGYNPDSD